MRRPKRPSLSCFTFLLLVILTAWPGGLARGQSVVSDCTQEALEAAIEEAILGDGWVTFECDGSIFLTNTISLATDEEEPSTNIVNVIIDGTGRNITMDGRTSGTSTNSVRLFHVGSGISLTVTNVRFINGQATNGGAFYVQSNASLLAVNCIFSNNLALGSNGINGAGYSGQNSSSRGRSGGSGAAGANASGGAIYNLGSLSLSHCAFLTNGVFGGIGGTGGAAGNGDVRGGSGGGGGRGGTATGGAIYNQGTLETLNCAFYINFAVGGTGGAGGTAGTGIFGGYNGPGGTAGGAAGGAIFHARYSRGTNHNVTFAANIAAGGDSEHGGSNSGPGKRGAAGAQSSGGAVANHGTNAFFNSTFFANAVTGGLGGNGADGTTRGGTGGGGGSAWGGGIFNGRYGTLNLMHCTIANGEATGGTNGAAGGGPLAGRNGSRGLSRGANIANSNGTFRVTNSIIAYPAIGTNAYGKNFKGSNNIVTDLSLKSFKTVFTNVDPRLEALQFNGGHVQTMELLEGSPAIDFGHNFAEIIIDARGVTRTIGTRADAGAYEYGVFLGPPRIATQPTGRKVREGGTIRFSVVARGDGPLRYQWRKDGEDLDGETADVLELFDLADEEAGAYSVLVSNNSGSTASDAADLTIAKPPTITEDLEDVVAAKGESFSLSVTATGDAPLRYEWYRDGTLVPGATLSSFFVSNISTGAIYQVVVRNDYGDAVSVPAAISVIVQRPGIATQPASQVIASGRSATFAVSTTGSRPQTYQWYFNQTNIITGATNDTFRIATTRGTNSGNYMVVISNEAGSTNSTNATLMVVTNRPIITTQPASISVIAGSTANFNVVTATSEPARYQWYFNTNTLIAGATNSSLSITNAQTTNQGGYRVVISNVVGSTTSIVASLTIQPSPPVITTQPADRQLPAGVPITLTVGVSGSTPITFLWYHTPIDSFGVPTSGPIALTNGTNATLTLPIPEIGQEGRWEGLYYVAITNIAGGTISSESTVNIEGYGVPP